MSTSGSIAVVFLSAVMLTGCAGTLPVEPTGVGCPEIASVEESANLANLDGEWVATRTVVEGTTSAAEYTVGYTEDRLLGFETSGCDESCEGTVRSGATLDGRTEAPFEQSDSLIRFHFEGFNDCLDVETGALLYADGYEYLLVYELAVDSAEASGATELTGSASNLYTATPEALAAGCETGTGRILYDVTAVRG